MFDRQQGAISARFSSSLMGALGLLAGLLVLAACGGGTPHPPPPEPTPPPRVEVSIPDANLRAEIERVLEKTSGATIYRDEMAEISSLTAESRPFSR